MKPSPMLEEIRARHDEWNERANADWTPDLFMTDGSRAHRDRAALLALISAQPGVRMYPIMRGPAIPWNSIAPFDHQAKKNHGGQSLEHMAKRGGLAPAEAVAILECRDFKRMDEREAILRMIELTKSAAFTPGDAQPGGEGVTRECGDKICATVAHCASTIESALLKYPSQTDNFGKGWNEGLAYAAAKVRSVLGPTSPDPARAEQVPEREGK